MTGSDLIVVAPWILFAIGLAVIYIRLLRARHAGRQPPGQSGPRTPGPADPGRPAAGSPAPADGPRNHQLPLPIGRSVLDEQRAQPAAPAAVPAAGRSGPRWRALLEDRWQTRLREVTELSLAYHQATDVIPHGQDASEGGPEAQQLLDRTVAARDSAIGVTVTGLMIGGAAYFWQEILGFFAGLSRKLGDEAATLEKSEHLRRVA